ncbi:MAG TPA: protein-L-isoaspartate(D-aspartate) O-methyltransferase [Woeseiaceae bacterium]
MNYSAAKSAVWLFATLGILTLVCTAASAQEDDGHYQDRRAAMVDVVRDYATMAGASGDTRIGERVLAALAKVPRHEFVPDDQRRHAYDNRPLPIGHGQTISQPYIVALMTQLADPDAGDVVLEIGTGSGYQAAILAELVDSVYSIEIVKPLADSSAVLLDRLGYDNVTTRLGDGYFGWAENGPYDAIVVTAAASHVPRPLIEQLRPGGRMVIPVGDRFMTQQLLLVEKTADEELITRQIAAVRFVPLTGDR